MTFVWSSKIRSTPTKRYSKVVFVNCFLCWSTQAFCNLLNNDENQTAPRMPFALCRWTAALGALRWELIGIKLEKYVSVWMVVIWSVLLEFLSEHKMQIKEHSDKWQQQPPSRVFMWGPALTRLTWTALETTWLKFSGLPWTQHTAVETGHGGKVEEWWISGKFINSFMLDRT